MHLSITNYTRTQHIAKADDLGEFELTFEPVGYSDTLVKVEGNKAVIGYIAYDTDCENPMTSCDCMGEFITYDSRSISDGNPFVHLGLTEAPYRGEISRDLECDGVYEAAVNLLKTRLIHDSDFLDYCEEEFERVTEEDKADMAFMEACIDLIDWGKYGTPIPLWLEAIWEVAQDDAWDQLYAQGKIGTYLAVPCRWHDSVHGPGTAEAYTCNIEDCNAVWIPTKDDIENIKAQCWPAGVEIKWHGALGSEKEPLHAVVTFNGEVVCDTPKWSDAQRFIDVNYGGATFNDLQKTAIKYAQGCLEEYVKWCNGECYGVVAETYTRFDEDSEWELVDSDHCWGFIGMRYAEEECKRNFEYQCGEFFKDEAQ